MNEIDFVNRVKKYFSYLEYEYHFKITHASNSDVRSQTDGVVEYNSDVIAIVIDSETGSAALWFYRIKDGKKYDLDPVILHEYLQTTDKEKELLLSTNPDEQHTASALFDQKFLLNQPGWRFDRENTTENNLEIRLRNYANWLRLHANLCLQGDLSWWPKLYEYKIHRARADKLRRGKDDLVYARIKNAEGNYEFIKQSLFKDDLEYIERLKKEFSL